MLEKCNLHTRWALFDIMLDFWECWKSANLTHFSLGHHAGFLGMLEKCNTHTLWALFAIMLDAWNAGKVQHSHTFAPSTCPQLGLPQLGPNLAPTWSKFGSTWLNLASSWPKFGFKLHHLKMIHVGTKLKGAFLIITYLPALFIAY